MVKDTVHMGTYPKGVQMIRWEGYEVTRRKQAKRRESEVEWGKKTRRRPTRGNAVGG
jgi:hypothetical protein